MSQLTDILESVHSHGFRTAIESPLPIEGHMTVDEAERAVLALIAEAIGEDERAAGDLDSDYTQGLLYGHNELRAEIRERLGLTTLEDKAKDTPFDGLFKGDKLL